MGVSKTVLLPAGHPVKRPSTHMGKSNGLAAQCGPIETCYRIVQKHPGEYFFFANEVPDVENARRDEKYLKLGAWASGRRNSTSPLDRRRSTSSRDWRPTTTCRSSCTSSTRCTTTASIGFGGYWKSIPGRVSSACENDVGQHRQAGGSEAAVSQRRRSRRAD